MVILFSCQSFDKENPDDNKRGDSSTIIEPLDTQTNDANLGDIHNTINYQNLKKIILPLNSGYSLKLKALELPVLSLQVEKEELNNPLKNNEPVVKQNHIQENPPVAVVETPQEAESQQTETASDQMNMVNNANTENNNQSPENMEEETDYIFGDLKNITLMLPGKNWLFIRESEDQEVRLLRKEYRQGDTLFHFDFPYWGLFHLIFNQQDNLSGQQQTEVKTVLLDQENTRNSIQEEDTAEEPVPDGSESFDEILDWTLKNDQWNYLLDFFEKTAEQENGADDFWSFYDIIPDIENTYRFRMNLLDLLSGNSAFLDWQTSILFHLAQMLEKPGPDRNLKKAYEIYGYITDVDPFSEYADKSEDRIIYLERHYFIVR